MREIDFLPDWYKADKRRQLGVRRQYIALAVVFLLMMAFNITALQRASKAAAEGARLENQRAGAEAVVREFDTLTKQLNEFKGRAGLVEQIDSRVDLAALLAEMSHVISDSIVLRKMEIQAEPFGRLQDKGQASGSVVQIAGGPAEGEKNAALGRVKSRVVLVGVAAHPADVADLVCRLDASKYFQRVRPSYYGNAKGALAAKSGVSIPDGGTALGAQSASDITEFEITCYLANYKEMDE